MIFPKHTLLAFLVMPTLLQAAPSSFSGFHLGAHLGWMHRIDSTHLPFHTFTQYVQGTSVDKKKKSDGITYGVYGGYGQNCNGFYWGGEFSIDHNNANKMASNKIHEIQEDVVVDDMVDINLKTKYERGVVFGLTPRIGAIIANENLIYVKLGVEISRDTVFASREWISLVDPTEKRPNRERKTSKTQVVFVPGIGYERAFGSLLVRAEYSYNMGSKITTPDLLYSTSRQVYIHSPVTVKYSAHILKFGLAYKF